MDDGSQIAEEPHHTTGHHNGHTPGQSKGFLRVSEEPSQPEKPKVAYLHDARSPAELRQAIHAKFRLKDTVTLEEFRLVLAEAHERAEAFRERADGVALINAITALEKSHYVQLSNFLKRNACQAFRGAGRKHF